MAAIEQNQTIFDFCLQNYGTLENLFDDVLVPNKKSVDKKMLTGEELNIDTFEKGIRPYKKQIQEEKLIFTNVEIDAS